MQYCIGFGVGSFNVLGTAPPEVQLGPVHFHEVMSESALSTFNIKFSPIQTGLLEEITGTLGIGGSTRVISVVPTKHSLPNAAIFISV